MAERMVQQARAQARQERVARYAAMVLVGKTLTGIAAQEGLTRERVRQVLAGGGFTLDVLRPFRVAVPERRTSARVRAETPPRAICEHCKTELKRPVRADGQPRFCMRTRACKAAKMRYRYATNAGHRAYMKAQVQKAHEAGYFRSYYERNRERINARLRERRQERRHAELEVAGAEVRQWLKGAA